MKNPTPAERANNPRFAFPGSRALDHRSLRVLVGAIEELYVTVPPPGLPEHFARVAGRVVPAAACGARIRPAHGAPVQGWFSPVDSGHHGLVATFSALFHEFPVTAQRARTGSRDALAISDCVTRENFHRSALYNEYYRCIGLEDDLSVHVVHRGAVACVAVARGRRNFSLQERLLLNALRPHFRNAWELSHASAPVTPEKAAPIPGTSRSATSLQGLGLTPREAEVLFWVAQGKTNPETGVILGIRPYTVRTHLERVFAKLGVESRHAATLRALEVLGLPRLD